jgi:hypothetical protein
MMLKRSKQMTAIYDFGNFDLLYDDVLLADEIRMGTVEAFAVSVAQAIRHSVVLETDDNYVRVTPNGAKLRMPDWFMPATLGGKP